MQIIESAGPSVEPGSSWSKPNSPRDWTVENVLVLNGEPYASLIGPWSHHLEASERAVVPVLTLITDWRKRGHDYPAPVEHFACERCGATLDATAAEAERAGWWLGGMGSAVECPEHR